VETTSYTANVAWPVNEDVPLPEVVCYMGYVRPKYVKCVPHKWVWRGDAYTAYTNSFFECTKCGWIKGYRL